MQQILRKYRKASYGISFCVLLMLLLSSNVYAQEKNEHRLITVTGNNITLAKAFQLIKKETGLTVFYNNLLLNDQERITVNLKKASLSEVLDFLLSGRNISYEIRRDRVIVLTKKVVTGASVSNPSKNVLVTGKITDEKGEPLAGVSIRVKGKNVSAISDSKGTYKVTVVSPDDILVFVYIGFETVERKVANSARIDVVLKQKITGLDQVVVIGYGEVKRSDLTGSVGEVKMADLQKAPVPNFDQALAGRIAGVQVSSNEGQPGSGVDIVIRGGNSLTQSNAPLYVIDGFPMEDFSSSSLNPEDIESISVLKDASATAIYGSRGANGVIIIETKKGKIGPPQVAYHGYFGIQEATKRMNMMNPYEFVKYQYEMNAEETNKLYFQKPGMTLDDYKGADNIDWQSLLFRRAAMQNHNLSIRGATNATKYSFSGSLSDQDGIIINSGFNRAQGRITVEQTISKKLKANININYAKDKNYGSLASEMKSSSNSYASYLMYRILGYRPVANNVDIIDNLIDPEDEDALFLMNPLISTKNEIRQETKSDLLINSGLNYNITNELTLNVRGGYNQRFAKSQSFNNSQTYKGFTSNWNPNGANGTYGDIELGIWVNENRLTYKKRLNKDHYIDVTAAFTMQGVSLESFGFEIDRITNEELGIRALDFGIPKDVRSVLSKNTLMSYLSRVNYNLKSKYLFTASLRADGSSKFSPGNRWGVFPSGAFAWQMGKENFLKNSRIINNAKLRLSYGITGNNRISDFARFQTLAIGDYYSFGNETPLYAAVINSMGNQNLKWEKTAQLDLGYDISLLRNRVNLTIDAYDKTTSDLLLNANMPLATGFNAVYKNVGKIRNTGLEISLNTVNVQKKDFSWESSFNISFNKNKILKLSDGQSNILSWVNFTGDYNGSFSYIAKVGGPAASLYGYVWDGNYQYSDFDLIGTSYVLKKGIPTNGNTTVQPGDIKYVDFNKDGVVNEKDMVQIGRGLPIHYGGFTNNFTYRGFSLNVFFQWSYGNDIINANRLAFEGNMGNRINLNQFASYENRWTPDNPTNENFRVGGFGPKGRYSTKIIEDGSYLRLKTVQLSYAFPKKWRGKLKSLEVYGAAQNIYTWTNYSGYDPEVSVRQSTLTPGFDYSSYPRNLTVTAGVKANF
ncbi:TonB-dependent receptor [Pedobacter sp. BS3]|uniref:SusC/RagA family TonB-linked outer membrane protein n=1 Tax=Pedobacter sp. BS3 TaxID=2567937 RepID=UPI0011EC7E7A|nr:SusC/RagA family TonB-linked outer membrane protein [Pedobacter sp. BS3]TZF81101.1 TonB-dependent receptor [Pedobacter sp. BS3]